MKNLEAPTIVPAHLKPALSSAAIAGSAEFGLVSRPSDTMLGVNDLRNKSRNEPEPVPAAFVLETDRLWLRQFTPSDAEAVLAIAGNPQVMRFVMNPCVTSISEAAKLMEESPLRDYRKYGFGRWAVVLKENRRVIGSAGLKYLEDLNEVDLGYLLLPEYWGLGLATEIAREIVRYGFGTLRLPRIVGLVDADNVRSVRVLEKLGFAFAKMIDYRSQTTAQYVLHASAS